MMCKKPYLRLINASNADHAVLSSDVRQAATPFGCGQCLPCRINKAREWTHRIMLEGSLHEQSAFVTLTYNDTHYPDDKSVSPTDLIRYLKRLRYEVDPFKFRYFGVGEYGTKSFRPHYHLILFGLDPLNFQKTIDKKWGMGHTMTGTLSKDSARYITGYVVKKLNRPGHPELKGLHPEFSRSSRKEGGIGAPAVRMLANKLKEKKYFKPRVMTEIQYGKNNKQPLGRYLTVKFAEALGLSEDEIRAASYDFQMENIKRHVNSGVLYYDSILQEKAGARKKQEKRYKIFRKRAKI